MTKTEHTTTRTLIGEIETKDRRFRTWQSIFMALVFMVLIGVVYVQARTLAGVQQQLDQQRQLLQAQKDNTEELKKTTANVSKQLDCIAQFFAQRSRADAIITNLEQCHIVHEDGTIQDLRPAPNEGPTSGTNQQPATIDPNGPGLEPMPSNSQQPGTSQNPEPPRENPPVEILGIPVCVPFTNACVR